MNPGTLLVCFQLSDEDVLERVSSVLVDKLSDHMVIRVDSKGFHPNNVTIRRGTSVLWTWEESRDETHNIIHINPPQHKKVRTNGTGVYTSFTVYQPSDFPVLLCC